jgi:hypothetical protein
LVRNGNLDRVFCSGVNRIVWHTFTSSPKEFGLPGNEYFAGTHLNPNVTWWQKAGDFISYLNRCSYLLQQGLYVADVLYYYGDDVPNFVFLKEEYPELRFGYDWDKCSKDVILNRLSVDNGQLILPDGMRYRVLVLAPREAIDLAVLRKVEKLVKEGVTIVAQRPKEATGLTNYPESDLEINEIANHLWGKTDGETITENRYGKGRVIWGKDINNVLSGMQIKPDFEFKGNHPETAIDFIHRTADKMDIYFVANRFGLMEFNDFEYRYIKNLPDRYEQVECRFRITGKVPQFWNPITGEVSEIVIYREENEQTVIPLHFEPDGSKFIIFKEGASSRHITEIKKDNKNIFPTFGFETKSHPYIEINKKGGSMIANAFEAGNYTLVWSDGKKETIKVEKPNSEISLSGKWDLHFDPKWGGPDHIEKDELKSWIDFEESGIKYYSGTATYTKSFTLKKKDIKGKTLILDLGNVQEMASIKINGNQLATRWSAPFQFDISKYVKRKNNKLEVEVVNMWPNRLIGDGKLPLEKRFTKTNINKFEAPDAEKYLRESGLIGPVKILSTDNMKLK